MTLHSSPVRRGEWIALALILLLAAALRLGAPGLSEFKRDEANMMRRALDLARGRDLPLLGLSSSVNVPNPPISVYLFALPFVFSDSPVPATLFVGALNVAAVMLTWALARRWVGARAALIAALLYAASPWGAIYARKLWAQDLLPPFVVLCVFTLLLGYAEDRRGARLLHWPLLALTAQIHYAAATLIPLSLLALVLWPARVRRRELAIGLLLAALTLLPAALGAYREGWLAPESWRARVQTDPNHRAVLSTRALDLAWLTVAGTDIHALAGPEQFRAYRERLPRADPLFDGIPLIALLTAAAWLLRAIGRPGWASATRPEARLCLVLAAWLMVPVLGFTWEWTEVVAHYFIPLMPAAYLLAGAGIDAGIAALRPPPLRRAVEIGAGALLALIVVLHSYSVVALLDFVNGRATPGGFGTPLHYLLAVRQAILTRAPAEVIVISAEERAPFDTIPAVWGALLDPLPSVRFVNGTRTAVIPAGTAWELIAGGPGLRTCPDATCFAAPGVEVFPLRPGEPPYALRQASHELPLDFLPIEPVRFANGAVLIGYAREAASVALLWELGGPVSMDAQAFVHALDGTGARLAQADRPAWPGHSWRAGDRLVLWFDLALPPQTATLYAGLYTLEGTAFRNIAVVDAAGAYLAQGATIALGE